VAEGRGGPEHPSSACPTPVRKPDPPLPHAGGARARLDPGQAEPMVAAIQADLTKAVIPKATQLRTSSKASAFLTIATERMLRNMQVTTGAETANLIGPARRGLTNERHFT